MINTVLCIPLCQKDVETHTSLHLTPCPEVLLQQGFVTSPGKAAWCEHQGKVP